MPNPTARHLDALLGVHDVRINGGALLTRRGTFDVRGGGAVDAGGATRLTVPVAPVWLGTVTIASEPQNNLSPTGWAGATDIGINPVTGGTRRITGFDSANLTVLRKRLWNFTEDATDFEITHDDSGSSAENRVTTPDGLTMVVTPTQLVWIQRSADGLTWRAYRCE